MTVTFEYYKPKETEIVIPKEYEFFYNKAEEDWTREENKKSQNAARWETATLKQLGAVKVVNYKVNN